MKPTLQNALQLHQAGNLREAALLYELLLKGSEDDHRANFLYGTLQFQLGNLDSAIRYLNKSITLEKNYYPAYNHLGMIYDNINNYSVAIHYFENALSLNPNYVEALTNLGIACKKAGRYDEAINYFRRAIRLMPESPELRYNLGLAYYLQNDYQKAITALSESLEIDPTYSDALNARALCYKELRLYDSAINDLKSALEIRPGDNDIWYNMALVYTDAGRFREALSAFQLVDTSYSNYPEALLKKGQLNFQMKNFKEAFECAQELVTLAPNPFEALKLSADACFQLSLFEKAVNYYALALERNHTDHITLNNLGLTLQKLGRYSEALEYFLKALAICEQADYLNNAGVVCEALSRLEEAEKYFIRANALDPENIDALYNLGNVQLKKENYSSATNFYKIVLHKSPEYLNAYNNLGVALQQQDKLIDAEQTLHQGLTINDKVPELANNMGNVLRMQNRLDEAMYWFDRAIELRPGFAEAHKNRGLTLLLMGKLQEAWAEYEWRWKVDLKPRQYPKSLWNGVVKSGQRLFVYTEQGFGDTLQFMRFLPVLQKSGMQILFEPQPELRSLLENDAVFAGMLKQSISPDDYDYHIPLLSIAERMCIDNAAIKSAFPYFTLNNDVVQKKSTIFRSATGKKVGIVWAGNPNHKNDRNRSCSPEYFSDIVQLNDYSFYSLQKGRSEDLQKYLPSNVFNLENELQTFADTAGIIMNLDLIITVDTAVAHLAGMLGKNVFLLLAFAPDWRWQLGKKSTDWYPGVRLFRQPEPGNWKSVFREIKKEMSNGNWI